MLPVHRSRSGGWNQCSNKQATTKPLKRYHTERQTPDVLAQTFECSLLQDDINDFSFRDISPYMVDTL